MKLHPMLSDEHAFAELQQRWRETGNIRVEPLLDEACVRDLADALREQPFNLALSQVAMYVYWRCDVYFDAECDHMMCRLGRWLQGAGNDWVSRLTGQALRHEAQNLVTGNLYMKGSFLDPHNDYGKGRSVAYVLGLTETPWEAEHGGYLEFLEPGNTEHVISRRPPGWNSLDLFDVRGENCWHQVSLLRRHAHRLTVSGWFYPR